MSYFVLVGLEVKTHASRRPSADLNLTVSLCFTLFCSDRFVVRSLFACSHNLERLAF